jgi:hypothetical protein
MSKELCNLLKISLISFIARKVKTFLIQWEKGKVYWNSNSLRNNSFFFHDYKYCILRKSQTIIGSEAINFYR